LAATVYRRTAGSDWMSLGPSAPEGPDRLGYEDRTVQPGERYAYRLGYPSASGERFTEETWVSVPDDRVLALVGLTPNPGRTPLRVSFSLPNAEPATLELIDV